MLPTSPSAWLPPFPDPRLVLMLTSFPSVIGCVLLPHFFNTLSVKLTEAILTPPELGGGG